jgi:hypothetical protein
MASDEVYAAVIRQAAHDAVRALLTAPADSLVGSLNLREVTDWVATEGGPYAVRDLAEELAVDLEEAFAALAAVERRSALSVLDGWFHDVPVPGPFVNTAPVGKDDPRDGAGGADPEQPSRGGTP